MTEKQSPVIRQATVFRNRGLRQIRLCGGIRALLLLHLAPHKSGGTPGKYLFCLAHLAAAVTAAQDHGADDIAFTQDWTDDLGKVIFRIIFGNVHVMFAVGVRQNMITLIHDVFQFSGDR